MSRPFVVGQYNQYMGCTDRMDEDVSKYRIGICGKTWWWSLFTWLIDVVTHNAWVLTKCTGADLPQM